MSTIIRIQSIQKDLRAKELQLAREASLAARAAYEKTQTVVHQTRHAFGEAQSLGLDRETLSLYENYLHQAHNMLEEASDTAQELEVQTEIRRENLNQTFKVLKIYEKYEDTLLSRHETEMKQREAKELDERAIQGNKKTRR